MGGIINIIISGVEIIYAAVTIKTRAALDSIERCTHGN